MDNQQAKEILRKDISGELAKKWGLLHLPFIGILVFGVFWYLSPFQINLRINLSLPHSIITEANLVPPIFAGVLTACSIMIGFFGVTAFNFRHDFDNYVEKCQSILESIKNLPMNDENKIRKVNLTLNIKAFSHQMEHIGRFLQIYFIVFFCNLIVFLFIFSFSYISEVFVVALFLYA